MSNFRTITNVISFLFFVLQSSSVDIANADRPPSTTEPLNEEHSGAVTSSDVVMEVNPAYQPLEIANAHISK